MSVMREIKFRAWNKIGEDMHEVEQIDWVGEDIGLTPCSRSCYTSITAENAILMQYTELKDRNGKEIYESDIVRCRLGEHWNYKETIGTVLFHCGEWALEEKGSMFFKIKLYRCKEIEIIGNIYENPELLCEEKI